MEPVYDVAIVEDVSKEETDTLNYLIECMAFLDDYLEHENKLRTSPLKEKLDNLLGYWGNQNRNPTCLEDAQIDTFLFGVIGQAIYFLKDAASPQFHKELMRLFQDENQIRGNYWLLYTAARFKIAGCDVRFIDDGKVASVKTPDYEVTRGKTKMFVEANARSQAYRTAKDQGSLLWDLMHGGPKTGKQLKFTDDRYDPGLIAVDLSHCGLNVNDEGLKPVAELHQDGFTVHTEKTFVYDTTKDPAFFLRPQNNNNVLRKAIDYFQLIDKERYKVRGLLVGQSMKLTRDGSGGIANPRRSVLIVDHRYPELAMQELATAVYLVEPEPPDLSAVVRRQVEDKAFILWCKRGRPLWDAPVDWRAARELLGVPCDFHV